VGRIALIHPPCDPTFYVDFSNLRLNRMIAGPLGTPLDDGRSLNEFLFRYPKSKVSLGVSRER